MFLHLGIPDMPWEWLAPKEVGKHDLEEVEVRESLDGADTSFVIDGLHRV